ncbi:lytic murein transglycosylase B [Campylobacterota bacterium DY0563]
MNNIFFKILILFILPYSLFAKIENYSKNEEVKAFINDLSKNYKYDKKELEKLFSEVKIQKTALNFYKKPKISKKPKNKKIAKSKKIKGTWDKYEKMFITEKRVSLGASFMKKYKKELRRAYKTFGVQPEYITAILGVESFYGKQTGNYPVFDTLATLSFEKNRRNKFFKSELKQFLILSKKNKKNPKTIYGSYAGAIGLAQFMPSNFEKLAVDFNNDGIVDLNNEIDAIGSVANYLSKAGWNKTVPVATRVSYQGKRFNRFKTGYKYKYKRSKLTGIKPRSNRFYYPKKVHLIKLDRKRYDELWYGTENFYVITRYNRSSYYAMAVYKLAKEIESLYQKI